MKNLAYYNGEIAPLEEMRVPMNDRACWFGDGIYEFTLTENHIPFVLEEHIDRFFRSAALISMTPALSKAALADLLRDLVRRVDSPSQSVYWQLTRGTADRTHAFPENASPNLWVVLRPFTMPDVYKQVKLITLEDTRFLHCNIKTLNLLPNVLASEKAKQAGCYEAVFHRGDRVTEGSHANVHILKGGVLHTAPADNLILPGIVRAHLLSTCGKQGIRVEETPFTVAQMMDADEVLVTSSSSFCMVASEIDGKAVGGKAPEVAGSLQDALLAEFHFFCQPSGVFSQPSGSAPQG
jgi:D-alanine transaminase